jgi:hypothetical protein
MYEVPIGEDGKPLIDIYSDGKTEVIYTKDLTYFLD